MQRLGWFALSLSSEAVRLLVGPRELWLLFGVRSALRWQDVKGFTSFLAQFPYIYHFEAGNMKA